MMPCEEQPHWQPTPLPPGNENPHNREALAPGVDQSAPPAAAAAGAPPAAPLLPVAVDDYQWMALL